MAMIRVPIYIQILPAKVPTVGVASIKVIISPEQTQLQRLTTNYTFNITTVPIEIDMASPLITSALQFLQTAIDTYVDEDRTLKTLLNYGEDRQSVALAYRYGPVDENSIQRIQLKLLQPVPDDIIVSSSVFLSREVTKTLIDKVRIRFAPDLDATPYLRPKNLKVYSGLDTGKSLNNMTLQKLSLQSGSVGIADIYQNKTFEDEIFRQWYSYDFNSSELNIDFTDYNNFMFYGSAAMRLETFKEKLRQLEILEDKRKQILATYSANTASVALIYLEDQSATFSKQQEDIIRGFDRYEQYLYFTPSGSNSPYSASAYYADGGTEYNLIGYWPKSGSVLWPVSSTTVENWYETQSLIAQRFDEFNENNLVNTIPSHLREDDTSGAYITFVSMIGHFFDTIKPFVDQFPNIYSRNLNPSKELSKDLVNEIAESIGFRLPTLNSIYNLSDNILGTNSEVPRRDMTAEIYKRLLHNLPFFAKAKGTKTALETLLKTFGITSQLISVKETGTPVTSSYHVFDEFSTGLDFDTTKISYLRLPISASARNPRTMQFNCTVAENKTMTILTGDDKWALNAVIHPSNINLGRFEITSGSSNTVILSSSYHQIFGDELINITIQNYPSTASLYVTQVEGEDLIFSSIANESSKFISLWESTQYVYAGGAGPQVVARYNGTIDEVRLWNATLSDEIILNTAYDAGSNAGDTYSAAADNLLVQLSFNNLNTALLIASSSVLNESPYKNKNVSPTLDTIFTSNVVEADFVRYNRSIRQDMPMVGATGYLTSKIKVAPAPIFIDNTKGSRLYRTKSIVQPQAKRLQAGRNKVIMSMSPTQIINQNIIRNFGLENINAVLGSPTTLYTTFDKSLEILKRHYQQYHYVTVNTNRFIRILSDLSSVLDQVVEYFIPSKATLLKGIIIEPNILEQVKIAPVKNMRLYGKNTKKTLNAANSLTGSKADYGATFNVSDSIDVLNNTTVDASYQTYTVQESLNTTLISADVHNYTSSIEQPIAVINATAHNYTSSIEVKNSGILGNSLTFNTRHEEWNYVSSGSTKPPRPVTINIFSEVTGSYGTLKTQVESIPQLTLHGTAQQLTASAIDVSRNVHSAYATYNIKHEDWNYAKSSSNSPSRPSNIDLQLNNMNKVAYNDVNKGSVGAEPYNRIYTRKLFEFEIDTTRIGGIKSTYIPALYDIPPSADFRDFGVYTYFDDPEGIYTFPFTTKTPVYPRPLNQTWNETTQAFQGITTWSLGSRYNINDVVYQTSSVKNTGNYYVFTTRASYTAPLDGTAFYSGSVPSYTPPSLDRENWEILRFNPIQRQIKKRIIFDTYTTLDPALNNFKTTTIDINKIIDIPDRYVDLFQFESVQANSYSTGELSIQNIALLFAIQSSISGLRLRLYRTPDARDADLTRPIETRPTGDAGVLVDLSISTTIALEITNPIATLVADSLPPAGKLFYTLDNLENVAKISITMLLYYFTIEVEKRIPFGYLRKHYRFFRDNSTATKRRNYVGCLNTIDTTIDGLPPVQVFLSEGTDFVVSPTQTNEEIITGGGGQLNVT